ncbi:hypothetical protein [Clostridium sp. BJN0013]
MIVNKNISQPVMPMESEPMLKGEEEFEENRIDKESTIPPVKQMKNIEHK